MGGISDAEAVVVEGIITILICGDIDVGIIEVVV